MTLTLEYVKKLMGWCPICEKTVPQTKQSSDFSIMASVPEKTGQVPAFRASNVVFPANYALLLLYFIMSLRLILVLRSIENMHLFFVGLLLLNISCYWIILKTFDAAVVVDKLGVHMQAFRLKELVIPYEEIKNVTSHGHEKFSKKEFLFLVILGLPFFGLILVGMLMERDWYSLLLLISLLLLLLIIKRKQKTRFENLNTQLYIRIKHKKWYEWTSHYSLITDEASAAEIKSSIGMHYEGVCNAKVPEVVQYANEDFTNDVPDSTRGNKRDSKNPRWLQRVSIQTLLFCVFLTCVNLLIYGQKGLESDYLLTEFLTGLFMVLFEFVFRWNKYMQRYDSIAEKSFVYTVPRIKSPGGLLVIIKVIFKLSVFFLFCLVLVPYMFNFSSPPISGALVILLCLAWGYYFRLIYWEKKNHMKICTKYENNLDKKYASTKVYAIRERRENYES